jgi:hypothetical protein
MFSQGFFREFLKFAGSDIVNLAIPLVRIVLTKPPTENQQLLPIKLADILFFSNLVILRTSNAKKL